MVTLLHLGSNKIIKPTNVFFSNKAMDYCYLSKAVDKFLKNTQLCVIAKNVAMTDVPALKLGYPAYFSASADCHRIMIKRHNAKFHLVLLNL